MKQIIVMVAMLILGIGIGTMVLGFTTQAQSVKTVGTGAVTTFVTTAAAVH